MKLIKKKNIFKRFPFTTLVLSFFGLAYIGMTFNCFMSSYCFMWDYDEFIPLMFYTFMMISAELYHNKGKQDGTKR